MNLFCNPNFLSRVLPPSSQIFTASFHIHNFSLNLDRVVKSEAWVVKVIATLLVFRCSKNEDFSTLECFEKSLTPSICFEVIKRLKDPNLGLKFFDFSNGVTHLVATYNFLVRGLCLTGRHEEASKLVFHRYMPDASLVRFLVSSCAEAGKFETAKEVLVRAHSSGVGVNSYTYNCLLNILVKRNQVDEAASFFHEQHLRFGFCPDTCSFNIVIRGLCNVGKVDRAFEFFEDMESFGCSPDVVSYNTLISDLFRANEVDRGHALLKEMQLRDDISPDVVTYTSLISVFCKSGKMEEASDLFDEMMECGIRPNTFTFNVIINGFAKAGDLSSALVMYEKMRLMACPHDVVTLTSLIDGYCRAGEVDEARKLFNEMGTTHTSNVSPNAYTFSVLINAFCKVNRLSEARDLLRQLKGRDVVPQSFMYNPVIDGFSKAGNVDEANAIMIEMVKNRCEPDNVTYTILIIGHCMKGRMLEAVSIFNKMLSSNCSPDSITVNSLRSRLLKAGMPNEANQLSRTLLEKTSDLNSWRPKKINFREKM